MFYSLARLRAIALTFILSASFSYSREESLCKFPILYVCFSFLLIINGLTVTSSVTYCDPPETLLIQQFDVAYIAKNQSIFFNISAASVEPNVNVSANLFLNVYGMNPVNVTIDLCSILDGALCPLPMYNFTGSDTLPLPASLGVSNRIPGIAFKIPDLEAFAQLTLIEISTGNMKACVQATLSNGWSAHQPAVEWSTGGLALFALFSALWHSLSPNAIAPSRFLELLYLYQSIVTTAFLSLNYPSVYRAFTLNFAWAMGMFSTSSSSSLQNSINNMRHLTGGNMANGSIGSAVGLVNRKLSPYNVPGSSNYVIPQSLLSTTSTLDLPNLTVVDPIPGASLESIKLFSVGGEVETVTGASSNILQAGLPIFVNSVHIATANAFMTVFVCALVLIAVALGVLCLIYVGFLTMEHFRWGKEDRRLELKDAYPSFFRAWTLRLALISFTPITVVVLYQWTLRDSWLSVLLSVILLLTTLGYILYSTYSTLCLAFRSTSDALTSHTDHLASHGPLYAHYHISHYYFFLPLLIASFLKAILVAFAKGNGEVQVILMLIVEVALFLIHLVIRPYRTKSGNVFSTFLAIIRLVCIGLMIAFVERLNVDAIPRVIIGIVVAVLFSMSVIAMFINLVIHSGLNRIWASKISLRTSSQKSADSMLEKVVSSLSDPQNLLGRPVNPTPERNIRLDPHINQPYYSTTSTPASVEQPSVYTNDSASTTVGSILPRRWSFSQPDSPIGSHLHDLTPPHSASIMTRQSNTGSS